MPKKLILTANDFQEIRVRYRKGVAWKVIAKPFGITPDWLSARFFRYYPGEPKRTSKFRNRVHFTVYVDAVTMAALATKLHGLGMPRAHYVRKLIEADLADKKEETE